jgi:hypothetical protein
MEEETEGEAARLAVGVGKCSLTAKKANGKRTLVIMPVSVEKSRFTTRFCLY